MYYKNVSHKNYATNLDTKPHSLSKGRLMPIFLSFTTVSFIMQFVFL